MSEPQPRKRLDTGIDCKDPYDRNDCGKCRDPPSERRQCISLCSTTNAVCKRSAMPGLPTCWQHFESHIRDLDGSDLDRLDLSQVEAPKREALGRRIWVAKTRRATGIPDGPLGIITEFGPYPRVRWNVSEPKPLDWDYITHLELYGEDWPATFPPKLKDLFAHGYFSGTLTVPETVTHLHVDIYGRSYLEEKTRLGPPISIEELTVNEATVLPSLDFRNYDKLRKLNLDGFVSYKDNVEPKLGRNLEEVSLGDYYHRRHPEHLFPPGANNLRRLTLGTTDAVGDPDTSKLQEMLTIHGERFPKLQSLSLYRNLRLPDMRPSLPPSITRLTIPQVGKMYSKFFQGIRDQTTLRALEIDFLNGWKVDSLDELPKSLEYLEMKTISALATNVDLRKLRNLSTVRLTSAYSTDNPPEILLPPKVSTLYMNGHRIDRW